MKRPGLVEGPRVLAFFDARIGTETEGKKAAEESAKEGENDESHGSTFILVVVNGLCLLDDEVTDG